MIRAGVPGAGLPATPGNWDILLCQALDSQVFLCAILNGCNAI